MKILNPTGLQAAPLAGRLNFPRHSVTWIVKGTFDLKPNGQAVLAARQPFPSGEEHYADDTEKNGSPRYESDFAWHKPRADLLLVGACHPAGSRPVSGCQASFRVGELSKTVGVLGNRRWKKHGVTWEPTEPEPFTRMELRYENSFGGADFPANPVGKGLAELSDGAGGKYRPLPNIEDPANPILSRGAQPAPAGFGPLGRTWAIRQAKLGTYKGAYRKTRWPWVPEDFDWTYFNAAPPDLQLNGFLRGDEPLAFQHLHPEHARYESQLPGLRVRCFVCRSPTGGNEPQFGEVGMNLDTLWVDLEAEKLVLVWRGWSATTSEEFEDIRDFFVITEPLTQPPALAEHVYAEFLGLKSASTKPFAPETPPPAAMPETRDSAAEAAALEAARKKEKEETKQKLQAQVAALNAQLGFDKLPPDQQQQVRDSQARVVERLAETDPVKSGQMRGEALRAELRQKLGKLGLDLDNLPSLTGKARAEQQRLMQELGLEHPDVTSNPQMAEMSGILGAVLSKATADPENLEPLIAEVRKQKEKLGWNTEPKPEPRPEVPKPPPLSRESVQAKLAEHGNFEGADLRGLDLSGLDLHGADFSGANLAGVPLRQTNLQQANFSKANLAGADFAEADLTQVNAAGANCTGAKLHRTILKEADLAGARLAKADLTKAILDGAILDDADFNGACLAESSAVGASFVRADLTDANLQKANCAKANYSKATLHRADFREANLSESSVIGAAGHQVNLAGAVMTKLRAARCDFTGAKLSQSQGKGSIWKGANLTGADLRYARMEAAMFTGACLKDANLSAANMKLSRFNKANLAEAKLIQMNLFQGSLERANLAHADLSGSNLYEVEFLDAVLEHTQLAGANVKMTKLVSA